ncbi:hypothetical protein ACXJJ3_05765 [Kribbella sp. WER1]
MPDGLPSSDVLVAAPLVERTGVRPHSSVVRPPTLGADRPGAGRLGAGSALIGSALAGSALVGSADRRLGDGVRRRG